MGIINKDGSLYMATGIDNTGLYSGFNQAEKRIDDFEAYIKKAGNNITRLTGIGFGVAGLKAFGSEIINVRGEMQMLETSFDVLLSGKGVSGFISELKQFAVDSPLSLTGVSQSAQTLLGFGIAAEKVMPTIKQLGDVSMGNEERFKSLSLAFAQMSATGKLMGNDLLQFISAGFNPLQTISEKTGKSIGELKKEMESGSISSQMVADAFASATSEGGKFYGMTQKQAEGIRGLQAQLEGGIQDAYNNLGKSQGSLIAGGYKLTISLVENYETIGKAILGLITTYGAYKAAVVFATQAESGWNAVQLITYNRLLLVEKAQKFLNATMLANPYVLLATVTIGLVATIWAMHDATTAQESAQSNLNRIIDESKSKKEELGSKSSQLIDIINSETKSIQEQILAYKELQKEHQKYLGNKSFSDFKSLSLKEQQKILDQSAFDLSGNVIEESISKYNKIIDRLNTSSGNGLKGVNESVSVLKEISKELGIEGASANYVRETLKETLDLLEKEKSKREEARKEAELMALPEAERKKILEDQLKQLENQKLLIEKQIPPIEGIKNEWTKFSPLFLSLNKQLGDVLSKIEDTKNKLSDKPVSKNKSFWEKEKKDAEDALELMDETQEGTSDWKIQLDKLNTAKVKLGIWDFSGKSEKKAETAADKAKKLQQELKALQAKLSNEQLRRKLDSKQKEIDADEEGFNKQLKQNALNYEKELQQIKEFEDDKTKEREEATLKFGKDKVSVQLPELSESNIKAQVEKLKQDALSAFNKSDNDVFKKITEQYQSYADQRLDIEKKFNKDIDTLIKLREKAQEKGDKEAVNKLNRSIAKATTDKGKDLISFDFERMKEAPEYIRAFEDLGTTSTETLNSLLGQFEKFKEEAAKTLSPKDLREYTATIQSIADELSNRDLYGSLIKQKDEAVKANQRLIKAENDLRLVKLGIGDPLLTEEEAIKRVNKAKDEYYNKNKKVLDTQKKIRDQISALAKEMSGLGNALGGTSGEIISFIGDITSFYTTASEGIEKVAQTGAQAISVVEKASVILTIISTAIQLMKQLNSILPDAFSQYEKYDEKIERINNMRDAVNEYEIAVLKASQAENSWFGNDSLRNLKDYKELQAKIFDSYRDKMLEGQAIYENKGSGGWLTNSLKSAVSWVSKITYGFDLLNKKYKEGTTAAVNNLRIETRKKSSGFLGSGIGGKSQKTEDLVTWAKKNLGFDLFDAEGWINREAYDAIISKYGDKLVGQTKETLDELKGLRDQYDEYLNQLHEYVSSLYEPLVDNMVDSIWDWFDEGKNALDSFKDYAKQTFRDIVSDMIKTILLKDVFKDFKDNIAKLYEEYSKGNLTEAQLSEAVAKETNSVMDRYKTQLPAIQGMVDAINKNLKDTTGIDLNKSTSYSQSSSKGSYETITQDQAGAIDGRLTGIHEVDLLIQQNTFQLVLLSTESNQLIRGYKEEFMAIRNVLVESRFLWEEIRDSNNELYEIKDILQEIKKNTKGLITK